MYYFKKENKIWSYRNDNDAETNTTQRYDKTKSMYVLYVETGPGSVAQTCAFKRDRLWVQFLLREMEYLIFSSLW